MEPDQRSSSNVVAFRPRPYCARHDRHGDNAAPQADISRSIDLSRYELPTNPSDDFRARMVANVAALVLLVTLVAVAAIDVVDIEKIERCAPGRQCGFTANADR
jgi:hypothetical protein